MRTYMCIYAHKICGGKGTKKNWDVQIYEGKSAENLNFVREMGGFGEYRTKKEEKKSAATAVCYVIKKIIKKNNIK